jgi:transcription initiation factor TFIIIB Brf1 subunit/transcription initiation factor TFIIB
MVDIDRKISLKIKNITISEAKRIAKLVRKIESRNPDRFIFIQILGLEDKSAKEASKILKEIFPSKKTAR